MNRRLVRRGLAAASLGLLFYAAHRAQSGAFRPSVAALDAGEVAAAAEAGGLPASDIWQRAEAMGVGAAVVRRRTLGGLVARGDVLLFSRQELEKWKSLGFVAPSAALKPNAIWVKDPGLLAGLTELLAGRGLVLSTASACAHGVIETAREPQPDWPGGLDPEDLASASAAGLIPVELEPSGRGARAAGGGAPSWPAAVFEPSARLAALLRAVHGRPGRLLLLRLDPAASAEENLARLRALLRPLRELGVVDRRPLPAAGGVRTSPGRRWLAWLLAVLGPILAVRLGVASFKRARLVVQERRPAASPVAELAAGTAATAATGAVVGLLLAASAAPPLPDSPAFSAMAWPMGIGLLALFPLSPRALGRRLETAPSYLDLLKLALAAVAALLLFQPRLLLSGTAAWGWLSRMQDAWPSLWWWPWRWREALIGVPALLFGLRGLGRRSQVPAADPRPWLWLGLLLPIGTIAAFARPGPGIFFTLGCTVLVLAAGLAWGGVLLALRREGAAK
ncbi:MAG: hypothetical protein PHF00_06305 [Elusimicrobia bacterium]|nr:hypothetical protein [Elusimicrobiota bacterium]